MLPRSMIWRVILFWLLGTGLALADSVNFTDHNFYHADGNGNIMYLVKSSQTLAASYRYDPYGNLTSSSGSLATNNTYRFSSKEFIPRVSACAPERVSPIIDNVGPFRWS